MSRTHAAAQRYDAGRTQEAGHGLGKGHHDEPHAQQHEGPNGAVGLDLFRYKPVEVVDENIFQVAFAPRNKGIGGLTRLEKNFQNRNDEHEGEDAQQCREEVEEDIENQIPFIGRNKP